MKSYTDQDRENILQTMREGVPFIALCAEKVGVNRKTVEAWLNLGKSGDPRYEDFTRQVYEIRAAFMLKHAEELLSADKDTAERARQRNWLLQRLDRTIFDPPREIYEKVPSRTSPDQHATNPTSADPAKVAEALQALSQPLTTN